MTDIDEAFLAERERIRAAATKGYQSGWRWRKHGFAHMPWQVHAPNKFDMADIGTVAFAFERDDAAAIVDAVNSQPALIAEIRRLRLLVLEAFDVAACAASTHLDHDPDAAHQAVRDARAAIVDELEAGKPHPEFQKLEQKFDPRDPTPSWFVGGGA